MDLPPFIDNEQPGGGINAEIVNAAMAAGQVEFVFTALPLQTMLKYYLLEENALGVLGRDLELNAQEQANLIFVPLFIAKEEYWYHQPSQQQPLPWNGKLESLRGRSYGAFKGEDVSAYRAAGINIEYGRGKGLVGKLVSGKLDFIRLPALSIDSLLDRHYPQQRKNVTRLEPEIGEAPLFIAFNKKHSAGETIAAKFRQGLADIIANGRYREILLKYMAGEVAEARVKRLEHYLQQP